MLSCHSNGFEFVVPLENHGVRIDFIDKLQDARSFSACFEETRFPRSIVLVILEKNISIRFSHEPRFGVKQIHSD